MKMIKFIILCIFLLGNISPVVFSSDENIVEYDIGIENNFNNINLEDCKCETLDDYNILTIEELISYIESENYEDFSKPLSSRNLPDYFCWKDYEGEDWTTPAKDQGNCGSCWDFAAMGCLESIISIRENCSKLDPDLSEQYILSCLKGAGSCRGGLARSAFRYINLTDRRGNYCNGVVLESCMPYQADDDIECIDKCENWEEKLIPIVDYGYWYPDGSENDRDIIKTQIKDYGPVIATMLFTYYVHGSNNLEEWGWTHNSADDYYPYPGPVENANHQVVLVGWKDDSNIGKGGYWIVKNSCSSEWGYNGFFNIEYGSLNIDSIEIDWVEYNPDSYNNWSPKVNSGGLYFGSINEELNFYGNETVDPENDIVDYNWDFGDGTYDKGITQKHSYSEKDIYNVILTVTDSNGNIGIDETWAFIDESNNPPEAPILKGRRLGQKEKEFEYTFYSNDPDGDDVYYYLNWGDVYWTGSWQPWIGPYESGEKITLTNIWDTNGEYVVRVKAKDKYNAESDWSILPVKIPINKSINIINPFIMRLIQSFKIIDCSLYL